MQWNKQQYLQIIIKYVFIRLQISCNALMFVSYLTQVKLN